MSTSGQNDGFYMLRSAWIFLAAILLPSLVLAWLGVRSARDQQILLEHQQAIISQDVSDNMAKNVRNEINSVLSEFVQVSQDVLNKNPDMASAPVDFDSELKKRWALAQVGFAVDLHGDIYSPRLNGNVDARTFREENGRFLTNRENVAVYTSLRSQNFFNADSSFAQKVVTRKLETASPEQLANHEEAEKKEANIVELDRIRNSVADEVYHTNLPADKQLPLNSDKAPMVQEALTQAQKQVDTPTVATANSPVSLEAPAPAPATSTPPAAASIAPAPKMNHQEANRPQRVEMQPPALNQVARQVIPQNNFSKTEAALSNTISEESDFRRLIGNDTSGAIARFLDNKLRLMVWFRPSSANDLVFGAQVNLERLLERLRPLLQSAEVISWNGFSSASSETYCLALLDDHGQPVALSKPGFKADWKHPFVATEIGETLPHWEAALYLTDPEQMSKSARTLQLTLGLIVLLLVVAIVSGGSLIATDIRRQVLLAQQKTDFVSNVSHELKTPLTSIRMFADLLSEGRVIEPERQTTYLKIISAESARLTRLINNVLDFARQERGAPEGQKHLCDLVEISREVVEISMPHLEAHGQSFSFEIEAETLPLLGDRDALSQVLMNLLSNAEKYGGGDILVRLRRQETPAGSFGCVDILDRGPGIPPKQVESIFLPFYRLHDSLSSGISGSGLGLTLARRMARTHAGDITYTPRAGGGSCFTLTVPLTA